MRELIIIGGGERGRPRTGRLLRKARGHHSSTGAAWLHGHGAKGMLLLSSRLELCLGLGILRHRIRIERHLVRGALGRDGEASGKASIRVHRVIRCAHHNGGLLALDGGRNDRVGPL